MELLRSAKMLKSTKLSLSKDFSLIFRKTRRLFGSIDKDDTKFEDKVYLKYDKLVINPEMYVWDESSNQRRKFMIADGYDGDKQGPA